jgi:hypothetical protein
MPTGCAPPGKTWPKYILFAVGDEPAFTVTLAHSDYAYSMYGGKGPGGDQIQLQLVISGVSVHMSYRNRTGQLVGYIGGCSGNMVKGTYQVAGRPGDFSFEAQFYEWP